MRPWPGIGALLVLQALEAAAAKKAEGADNGGQLEELTAQTFVEKVAEVIEGTGKPPYTPVVMFHMPWCEHCKKTIPELEQAAEKVAEAAAQGQLKQFPAVPRVFLLSCSEPGADAICNNHTGKSYPSIVVFRGKHKIKFNRPRVASVLTWWIFRVSRPAVRLLETREPLDSTARNEVTFLLHVQSQSDSDMKLIRCWEQLGLDYIEEHTFLFTFSDTPMGKSLGHAPGVSVYGPQSLGLVPLPMRGEVDEAALKAWVKQNQFAPVVEMNPWTFQELKSSELRVVTLVHAGNAAGKKAMNDFRQKALELRQRSSYLFATMNSSDEESAYFLKSKLSLLVSSAHPLPRIAVLAGAADGQLNFWEDPQFPSAEELSLEALERLLSSMEAFHDESWASWTKGQRKHLTRFASSSWTALLLTVALPLIGASLCFGCCRLTWQALMEEEPALEDVGQHKKHAD